VGGACAVMANWAPLRATLASGYLTITKNGGKWQGRERKKKKTKRERKKKVAGN
jgi:hypothetical protein